jgi:hypothetical protein
MMNNLVLTCTVVAQSTVSKWWIEFVRNNHHETLETLPQPQTTIKWESAVTTEDNTRRVLFSFLHLDFSLTMESLNDIPRPVSRPRPSNGPNFSTRILRTNLRISSL